MSVSAPDRDAEYARFCPGTKGPIRRVVCSPPQGQALAANVCFEEYPAQIAERATWPILRRVRHQDCGWPSALARWSNS
jgi:hypothetical protein